MHNLIDSGAPQQVINERIAGLLEASAHAVDASNHIYDDHERRIRFLERSIYVGFGGLGLIATILELVKYLKP